MLRPSPRLTKLTSFALLALGLALASCGGCPNKKSGPAKAPRTEADRPGVKDCKEDLTCLAKAAHKCTEASAVVKLESTTGGALQRATWKYVVVGARGERCGLTRELLDLQVELAPEAPEATAGLTDEQRQARRAEAEKRVESLKREPSQYPETVLCEMDGPELSKALLGESRGRPNMRAWMRCRPAPRRP